MRIAVCIKQVPVVAALAFDAATRTLKREGVPAEVSAFDLRALACAVELKSHHEVEVVAMTMGPPQAKEALVECLALGADRAIHLCDKAFAGADTLATAHTLAAALAREQPDLIFCGRYSVDAETGQVGPEIAEILDLPQITQVRRLHLDPGARTLEAERETDAGTETVRTTLPVLITATEDLAPERFPSKAEREAAKTKPCVVLLAEDLGLDPTKVGAAGSPTSVSDLKQLESSRRQVIVQGADVETLAGNLADVLANEHGMFDNWSGAIANSTLAEIAAPTVRSGPNGVWVVAEASEATLRRVTLELLGSARQLADALSASVTAILLGTGAARHSAQLAAYGADEVLIQSDPQLEPRTAEVHAAVLAAAIRQRRPRIVLVPSTAYGRDVAPRVAARLELGLTGDCIDLGLNENGQLVQFKPAFGGLVVAPILSRTFPEMATVRPGMLAPLEPDHSRKARVETLDVPIPAPRVQVVAAHTIPDAGAELDHAAVVVGFGKGIGSPEDIRYVRSLAESLGAALCTTRDVVDDGWAPRHLQVGLTGRSIAPRLYLAVGIRGAFEHLVGVRRAGVIVAINRNPKAPIFKSADYGMVGDYREIVPALQRAFEARLPSTSAT